MIAAHDDVRSTEAFGPDRNTMRIKRWLDEDALHRSNLHAWMEANGLEKQALTNLLYGRKRSLMREAIASHFGIA